jgi:hypothetical protein
MNTRKNILSKLLSGAFVLALAVHSLPQQPRSNRGQSKERETVQPKNVLTSYRKIQEAFNQLLAGKFPFSDLAQAQPSAESDLKSINTFFRVLAENKVAARNTSRRASNYSVLPQEALDFLDQIENVRVFFDAFLRKKQSPALDFQIHLRTNRESEIGANAIIDSNLQVGNKTFRLFDTDYSGRWLFGQPVRLSLRWAKDAPRTPVATLIPLPINVDGQTATLTYRNKWSLLLLLLNHRNQGIDVGPYTLKFTIPTRPNPKLPDNVQMMQPERLKTTSVEVFMRLTLLAPGKHEPLILPNVFPIRAPEIPVEQSELVMKVQISPVANDDNPIAVDLVLVKDKKLLKELMNMSAKDWFKRRHQYNLNYPKETGLSAGSWEWVPGQIAVIDPIPLKSKFAGGLIFANYFARGAHRAVIDPRKPIVVTLGKEDITVEIQK